MILSDCYLFFACLGEANARYQKTLDREVPEISYDPLEFGWNLWKPVGRGTHQ